jgi:hypothetical protein
MQLRLILYWYCITVCFSSSDSEEDDDNIIISSPPKKRVPNGIREQPNVENQTTVANSNAGM